MGQVGLVLSAKDLGKGWRSSRFGLERIGQGNRPVP